MDAAASAFVAAHADAEALESGKIRCTVTGHGMRPIISELEAHWASKTYLKKKERAEYDFDQHAPWLVPHKSDPHLLWCTITEHPVSRQPKAVEAHVSGKRFRRMKKEWKAQQKAKVAQEAARAEKRARRLRALAARALPALQLRVLGARARAGRPRARAVAQPPRAPRRRRARVVRAARRALISGARGRVL